jgi:hypothetical protein
MDFLSIRITEQSAIAVAEHMRRGCPARQPSPKKWPSFRIPIGAFLPAAKKRRKFDPQTFPSTIGGRTVSWFVKKQTIFGQGDLSDAVFYIQRRAGKTHWRINCDPPAENNDSSHPDCPGIMPFKNPNVGDKSSLFSTDHPTSSIYADPTAGLSSLCQHIGGPWPVDSN